MVENLQVKDTPIGTFFNVFKKTLLQAEGIKNEDIIQMFFKVPCTS